MNDYIIYYEGKQIAEMEGIDERDALNRFIRNGGGGYVYGRLVAEKVK